MKILIGLSVIQTILLGILGMRMMAVDSRIESIAQTSLDVLAATAQAEQNATRRQQASNLGAQLYQPASHSTTELSDSEFLDAQSIRQILREEIAALPSNGGHKTTPPGPELNDKTRRLSAELNQELEYLIGTGTIDESSMAKLQIKIAKLPATERRKALTRLTSAMNSGAVDAVF